MNIDWSKAPEGTTHFDTGDCRINSFMKLEGGSWYFWPPASNSPAWCYWRADQGDVSRDMIKAPPTWTGEGLPPVGTHVVVHDDGSLMYGQGESGEVLAHVDGCAVIRMSYGLGCFLPRCLRTPEQIAADKRAADIETMRADIGWKAPYLGPCPVALLYDAGYRKQARP